MSSCVIRKNRVKSAGPITKILDDNAQFGSSARPDPNLTGPTTDVRTWTM
jgi:hypothetical protein